MAQFESYSAAILNNASLVVRDSEEGTAAAGFGNLSEDKTANIRLPVARVRRDADSVDDDSRLFDGSSEVGKGMVAMVVPTIGNDQDGSPGVRALLDLVQCQQNGVVQRRLSAGSKRRQPVEH